MYLLFALCDASVPQGDVRFGVWMVDVALFGCHFPCTNSRSGQWKVS